MFFLVVVVFCLFFLPGGGGGRTRVSENPNLKKKCLSFLRGGEGWGD